MAKKPPPPPTDQHELGIYNEILKVKAKEKEAGKRGKEEAEKKSKIRK